VAEKLRAELEILTAKAEKDLKRFDRSLAGVERRITSMGGKGGKSLKPLGEGLSAATVNANEFEKSMAAANARVIAFGASAGLIMGVQRALRETVRATIQVEKSLTDINVVLNTNTKGLQKFGDNLFKIAGQTGQGFKTVAVAATELARQGLNMEKTLLRTKDALILTRLTGMGAEEAVSSLTAAVNSFSKAGITSAQVVNKMAKVDQAFAVSSDDLAKAISRVGSSAVDAGVSMDELLAITTAVQQRTARGGAVIGNAFKTIFTRIGRTDVQKKLAAIGVATRDMQGQMLPATRVLENLSSKFQELSKTQQNQIAESVAGVFQVNILRSALGDLSSKYGVYNRALKESASATNEAYLKNEQLNQTLDALVNKTLANLTKAGAAIGGATLQPAIENVLGLVNSAIGAFGEGGRFEEFGKGIGKDLMEGLGKFIAGPGLVIATAGIVKLGASFVGFAKDALKGFADIGRQAANRKALETQITAELQRQPDIIKRIERGELSAANAARDMLAAMKASNLEATKLAATTSRISASMMGMGGLRRPGRAQGFIPNFADPNAERASAAMGGYKAGAIKSMNIPGQGSVMYNSAETVKRFPGMQQPAIMPPQGSRAGSNYQKAFGAAHGFDPYAASGLVPNFAPASAIFAKAMGNISAGKTQGFNTQIEVLKTKGPEGKRYAKQLESELEASMMAKKAGAGGVKVGAKERYFDTAGTIGLLGITGKHSGSSLTGLDQIGIFKERSGLSIEQLKKHKVRFDGMQSRSIDQMNKSVTLQKFSDKVSQLLTDPVANLADMIFDGALGNDNAVSIRDLKNKFRGNTQLLPPGAEGSIFEAAVNLGLLTTKTSAAAKRDAFDQSTKGAQKPFDFEEVGPAKPDFKKIFGFGGSLVYADAKRTIDNKSMGTLINKAYNRGIAGLPYMELLTGGAKVAKGSRRRGRALGHVPNFSPLGDAITRERAAGVPRSAIRVGASASLRSSGNPAGLGVYNTIDEPAGLHQGISRSRSMGINPKTHGVPNFVSYSDPSKFGGLPTTSSGKIIIESPVEAAKSRRSSDKFDKGSDRLTKAADKLEKSAAGMNMGVGKLMGLTSLAYMATPLMGSMGMEEDTQNRMMRGLGLMTAASMFGGTETGFRGGFGKGFGPKTVASGRGAFGRAPINRSFGSRLAGGITSGFDNMLGIDRSKGEKLGLKGAARGAGKLGSRAIPYVGTALAVGDMGFGIFDSLFNESPAEKAARQAAEAAAKGRENAIPQAAEQVMSQASVFAGGFGTMSNKVKAQSLRDMRSGIFGEGGLIEAGADSGKVTKIFEEFENSLGGTAKEVQSASEKMSDSLTKMVNVIKENQQKLDAEAKVAELRQRIEAGEFKKVKIGTKMLPERVETDPYGGTTTFAPEMVDDEGFTPKQVNSLSELISSNIAGGKKGIRERLINQIRSSRKRGGSLSSPEAALEALEKGGIGNRILGMSPEMRGELLSMPADLRKKAFAKSIEDLNLSAKELDFLLRPDKAPDGPERRFGFRKQATAARKKFGIDEDRTFFKNLQADFIQDDKTAALRRGYQDALEASTRGLYGESEIKLRETKKSLQEAYERNTFEAQSELDFLDRELAAGLQGVRGSVMQRFANTETQDKMLAGIKEVSGLRGSAAASRLAKIGGQLQDPDFDPDKRLILQEQQKALQIIVKQNASRRDNTNILDRANVTLEHGVTQAEIQNRIDKQIIDNKYKYNRVLDMEIKQKELGLQVDKNRFLRADLMTGKITGSQFASERARERSMRRDAEGMAGQPMASFGEIVEESFKFGPRDAAERFEQGMADVALTVRDGLKDSIKSVITGAEDFKTALVGVFDKLLDKTLDTGLDTMINSLFGSLGNFAGSKFNRGGYVPRGYNQGGVVTGGSGVRDDVMTFMQGGEYVIKKSAAQKIGYSTLNSINSYASGGRARVSLAKDFLYTGDDPTRPTGGGFKVSRNLSSAALFRDDDPQTSRIFGRQQTLTSYLEYRRAEQARRDAAIQRVKDQKKARRNKAFIGAAINIGMGAAMSYSANRAYVTKGVTDATTGAVPIGDPLGVDADVSNVAARGGSPALVMGGEYIMSPQTTAKYGTGFMSELNRGRLPGYQNGGMVGGGGGASSAITTNNVNLAINIDKSGQTSVEAQSTSGQGENQERQDKSEVEKQKQMGEAIRGVVLKEIERQQRPGGLLRDGASYAGGRRP